MCPEGALSLTRDCTKFHFPQDTDEMTQWTSLRVRADAATSGSSSSAQRLMRSCCPSTISLHADEQHLETLMRKSANARLKRFTRGWVFFSLGTESAR